MDQAQVHRLPRSELPLNFPQSVPYVLAIILLAALYFQQRRNSRHEQKMASLEQLYKRQAATSVEQGTRIASHGYLHQLQDAAALRQLRFNDTQIVIDTSQQHFSLEQARAIATHHHLHHLHDAAKRRQLRINHHQLGVNVRQSFLLSRQRDEIAHASREQDGINETQSQINCRRQEAHTSLVEAHDANRSTFEDRLGTLGDAYWELYWQIHPREMPGQEEGGELVEPEPELSSDGSGEYGGSEPESMSSSSSVAFAYAPTS